MEEFLTVQEEWELIDKRDLWIYNKLFLSRHLGHLCGPAGVPVPYPGYYIVRPSINLLGMGRFSRIEWIEKDTEDLHPAEFWCEIFKGRHFSVDFQEKEAKLVIIGEKDDADPLYKWKKWTKVDHNVEFPEILNSLRGNYEWINCEFIENNLIEVHVRQNPNFRYGNTVAIPVWNGQKVENIENLRYIEDNSYRRKGFYID